MSIHKIEFKNLPKCTTIFRLTDERAINSEKAFITGDFTNWDPQGREMKKLKDGTFVIVLNLPLNKECDFLYKLDENTWLKEPEKEGTNYSVFKNILQYRSTKIKMMDLDSMKELLEKMPKIEPLHQIASELPKFIKGADGIYRLQ